MVLLFVIRSQPVQSFQWGTDSVISVRFNPGEPNLLATSARYILSTLYLYMSCNCLCYTFQSFL
jgi:hypothetical protein